jgi:DNA mismatch endonuclease (patch repair protein)
MPDVFSKRKRSEVMSRIRSRGNKDTELALVKLLRAYKVTGWRRHQRITFPAQSGGSRSGRAGSVTADFVFRRERVAVFVDGCFWHGCPKHSPPEVWIRKSTMPLSGRSRSARTGVAFWSAKLQQNRERDRYVTRRLRATGWKVIRIWEHDLTKPGRTTGDAGSLRVIKRILRSLKRQMEPAHTRCWNLTSGKHAVNTPRS